MFSYRLCYGCDAIIFRNKMVCQFPQFTRMLNKIFGENTGLIWLIIELSGKMHVSSIIWENRDRYFHSYFLSKTNFDFFFGVFGQKLEKTANRKITSNTFIRSTKKRFLSWILFYSTVFESVYCWICTKTYVRNTGF